MASPERVLTAAQREALRLFGALPDSHEFALAGAAALAGFYLGHRRSKDLDIFTAADPLIQPVAAALQDSLAGAGFSCQVVRRYRTFVSLVAERAGDTVRIELAQDSPFELEHGTLCFERVRILSLRDLAANKLLAAFGRAQPRDLVDIYILVRDRHCEFDQLVRWAKEKDPGLDAYYLAQALRTVQELPDDASRLPVDMLVSLDVADMKRLLLEESVRLLERGLPV